MNKGFIKNDNNSFIVPKNLPSTNHNLLVLLHTSVQSLIQKSKGRLYSVGKIAFLPNYRYTQRI